MFGFLKSSAIALVLLFPVFAYIGFSRSNLPPDQVVSSPATAQDFMHRGNLYWKRGDYEAALADYTQVTQLEPGEESGYMRQGMALDALEREEEAIATFQQARAIAQNNGNGNAVKHAEWFIQQVQQHP